MLRRSSYVRRFVCNEPAARVVALNDRLTTDQLLENSWRPGYYGVTRGTPDKLVIRLSHEMCTVMDKVVRGVSWQLYRDLYYGRET